MGKKRLTPIARRLRRDQTEAEQLATTDSVLEQIRQELLIARDRRA